MALAVQSVSGYHALSHFKPVNNVSMLILTAQGVRVTMPYCILSMCSTTILGSSESESSYLAAFQAY